MATVPALHVRRPAPPHGHLARPVAPLERSYAFKCYTSATVEGSRLTKPKQSTAAPVRRTAGVELRVPGDGKEAQIREEVLVDVEAEEAGRVALVEAAEEGRVGGVAEPALGDEGGADERGGEADAEQDVAEEVVVAKNQRDRVR
ncbi:hypothetical protein EJB05_53881, partial [Eragrostis curvula]